MKLFKATEGTSSPPPPPSLPARPQAPGLEQHPQKRGSGTSIIRRRNDCLLPWKLVNNSGEMLSPVLINPHRISSADMHIHPGQETAGAEPHYPALDARVANRLHRKKPSIALEGCSCPEPEIRGLQKHWAASAPRPLLSHPQSRVGREGTSCSPSAGGHPTCRRGSVHLPVHCPIQRLHSVIVVQLSLPRPREDMPRSASVGSW